MYSSGSIYELPLSSLHVWDVQRAIEKKPEFNYKREAIGNFVTRIKEPVIINDDAIYRQITVHTSGKGVSKRCDKAGKNIGTKRQFRARTGQLIISRIDARNGAFGLVTEELDGAIVTNDFWLFDVSESISTPYLMRVLSTKEFQKYWQSLSSGTTNRQRVGEKNFCSAEIPVPSLKEQKKLLKEYEKGIEESNRIIAEAQCDWSKISDIISEYVNGGITSEGLTFEDNLHLTTVSLKELTRWDMCREVYDITANYPVVKLRDLTIGQPMYGANEKGDKKYSGIRYIRITDINEDGSLTSEAVSATKADKKYYLEDNDFLIARSGATVGKTFLYKKECGKAIFAGYLVKYKLDTSTIIPEYLLFYTKSTFFKAWIKENQRISAQPNINGREYLDADIILPPIDIQKKIVKDCLEIYDLVTRKKQNAYSIREEAILNFERKIFK